MKICFVAPANNYHTIKWCRYFTEQGHEVHVVSFIDAHIKNTTVHFIDCHVDPDASDGSKLKYLLKAGTLRKVVKEIHADIVNVHYATSYGSVAALAGLKNYVLSVWGTDVYEFPQRSLLHKCLLEYSLRKAGHLFSTSRAMANEASKYTKKSFFITPFGVNMELFSPEKRQRVADDGRFVIGTVKGLRDVYGIRYILEAAALFQKQCPETKLEVRIAGKGPDEEKYREIARQLGITDIVKWLGFISQEEAAREWADMDVAVIPSLQESFGVSAVEAQACGTAVVISDVDGLMEATKPGETAVVVEKENAQQLADAIITLYHDSEKRRLLAKNGREYVADRYELNMCFKRIEDRFKTINNKVLVTE